MTAEALGALSRIDKYATAGHLRDWIHDALGRLGSTGTTMRFGLSFVVDLAPGRKDIWGDRGFQAYSRDQARSRRALSLRTWTRGYSSVDRRVLAKGAVGIGLERALGREPDSVLICPTLRTHDGALPMARLGLQPSGPAAATQAQTIGAGLARLI